MEDINSLVIEGRLVKDVVLEKTRDGISMAKLVIANNRSKKNAETGETEKKVSFFELAPVFGTFAEKLVPLLKKGRTVIVQGCLDQDVWTDTEGRKHGRNKIIPDYNTLKILEIAKKPETASDNCQEMQDLPEEPEGVVYDIY